MALLRHIQRDRPVVVAARRAIEEACAQFLARVRHDALDALRRAAKAAYDDDDATRAVGDADWGPLKDEAQRQLERVAKDGAKEALEQVEADLAPALDQANAEAVAWAKQRAAEFVTNVSGVTRDRIREIVAAGLEAGKSNQDLAGELEESFWFSGDRAEMMARTETAFADNSGNVIGWKASGVVAGKEWKTSGEAPCPECEAMEGEIANLDEEFPEGDPPLHPRCECVLLPVLAEDED